MKKTYIMDPLKFAVSGVFSLIMLFLLPEFFRQEGILGITVFGAIGLFFLGLALYSSRLVTVSPKGVSFSYLGFLGRRDYAWSDLGEIGVCGLRLFKPKKWKSTGLLYIYFSEMKMDEDDRFGMVFNWPQKEYPYLYYSEKRLAHIQELWQQKVEYYNVDKYKLSIK